MVPIRERSARSLRESHPVTQNTHQREIHFWNRGWQYYIAGRFAVSAQLNPVAGNLLHHAIEFALKGALVKNRTLKELRGLNHGLDNLWQAFKAEVGDPKLSQFDKTIATLHAYEDLRYPDNALLNGMESVISSHRIAGPLLAQQNPLRQALPPVRKYELCLQDVDELTKAIFTAAKRNPRFFFNETTGLKAREALLDGNLADLLEDPLKRNGGKGQANP